VDEALQAATEKALQIQYAPKAAGRLLFMALCS
jgi:hypothetical protein